MQGYKTNERNHHADFYYVLKVKVIGNMCNLKEIVVDEISLQMVMMLIARIHLKFFTWKI